MTARVEQLLVESGALLSGHFLLSSGRHSDRYCQCARLFEQPALGAETARIMAGRLHGEGVAADAVVAPALGGVLWGYDLARALGVRSLFAERGAGGRFTLRRGFALEPGTRVIVAEDVVTTGKSVGEVIDLLETLDVEVLAVASVVDRSGGTYTAPSGAAFVSLVALDFQTWDAVQCPLCASGGTAVKPGSRPAP